MPDEPTFMDLVSLLQITPNTPLEKLGSALNSSIFDASNIAGTLKQKGLIEFTAYYPGPNTITITPAGTGLISEANLKSAEPLDHLDTTILQQLSGGKRSPLDLQNTLNLRPKDLALRLYKLYKQGLAIYELKSGTVAIMLTEKGFLNAKATPAQQPANMPAHSPAPELQSNAPGAMNSAQATMQGTASGAQKPGEQAVQDQSSDVKQIAEDLSTTGRSTKPKLLPVLIIVVAVIIIAAAVYFIKIR